MACGRTQRPSIVVIVIYIAGRSVADVPELPHRRAELLESWNGLHLVTLLQTSLNLCSRFTGTTKYTCHLVCCAVTPRHVPDLMFAELGDFPERPV